MKFSNETRKALEKVFRKYSARFAYLFGSAANGEENRESDIDIAVALPEKTSKQKRFGVRLQLMAELNRIFKRTTDVIILNDVSSLFFKYVIFREGKLLFEASPEDRYEFEGRLMSLYFDFSPFLDSYRTAYVKNNLQ